ncbi:MAG: hypothetical protein IJ880_14940 [Bacilli bacterium]|nr:hypothetical protein [Bacilli bacterium]
MSDRYFIAKGKHLVVPVTKQEYEDYWNKKREEQTEEEWLKSLNTKQFAKWLDNLLMRCLCRDCNFCPIHKEPNCTCEGIEEWLKQPHKEDKHNEII